VIRFVDGACGPQQFTAGKDFGDFIVWRHDDVPAYQLAVVVDDAAMAITDVVRGADLLKSTARQLLLYRVLERPTGLYHCPLMRSFRTRLANGTILEPARRAPKGNPSESLSKSV
jgi:glutamyl-tRNA synthetase